MAMPAYRTVLGPPRPRRHERTACSSLANSDIATSSFLEIPLLGRGTLGGRPRTSLAEPGSFEPDRRCETNRRLDHVAACLSLATRWSPDFLARSSRQTYTSCLGRHPRDELTIRGRRLVMVPRRLYTWNVALLILLGLHAPAANAAPIEFTGFVPNDFNPATNPGVVVTPVSDNPLNIGQPASMTAKGLVSGWSIEDIRTYYSASNDTLYVGINTFKNFNGQYAPFGQANGDTTGTPTGDDPAHLSGDKSIAIAFAPVSTTNPTQPGTPLVIVGVPADKSQSGKGIDGFTVSKFNSATAAD